LFGRRRRGCYYIMIEVDEDIRFLGNVYQQVVVVVAVLGCDCCSSVVAWLY
jgi:hypothetical protein